MPDWTKLVGGWFLAVVVALALSWGAVAQVRNRVIQPSIEIPTTAVAAAASQVAVPDSTAAAPTVTRVEPEIVGSDGTVSTPAPDPSAATTRTSGSTPTTAPPDSTPSTSSTTSPTTTTTTTQPPPTTTTTQPPPTTTAITTTTVAPAETQTTSYQLVGGVVTISHSPGVVNFVTAVPQPGYSTDLRESGPERVRVRFESESHTSDFRAEWEGSDLKITKNETGES